MTTTDRDPVGDAYEALYAHHGDAQPVAKAIADADGDPVAAAAALPGTVPPCAGCRHQHTVSDGSCGVWSDDDGMCWCERYSAPDAPAEPDVAAVVGQDIQAAWDASQARMTDEILDELETGERDAADALTEISAIAATALRDLRRGEINPDVVMLGAVAELRQWLGRLDGAIGTTPTATVKSAPEQAAESPIEPAIGSDERQVWLLEAGAELARAMPGMLDIRVFDQAHNLAAGCNRYIGDSDEQKAEATRVDLDSFSQLYGRLDTPTVEAHIAKSGNLHVSVEGGWLGRPLRGLTIFDAGPPLEAARAWLAEIGVEVQA